MLLLITVAFLLKRYGTQAVPLPAPIRTSSTFEAAIFTRDNPSDGCDGRTVLDILWSCLATTFACTWVSAHPNVPFKGEGEWTLRFRRFFLMFFSILAPEFMIVWAFKQWRGAVMIREAVNNAFPGSDRPWTTTHGHLLQMGGFRLHATAFENCFFRYFVNPQETYFTTIRKREANLIDDSTIFRPKNSYDVWERINKRIESVVLVYHTEEISEEDASRVDFGDDIYEGVLTFDALKQLLTENLIAFPTITEDEINDRSKGDALSKGFALLQLTWFLVQIIARAAQGLAVSELELTTAALAGLNSVMYIFWWSKPRDVRFPVVIRTKGVEELLAKRSEDVTWRFSGTETEFDLRKHIWTSLITSLEGMALSLSTFLVSLPTRVICANHELVGAVKVLLHDLYLYFVQTNGGLMGQKSTKSVQASATDKEDNVAPEVVGQESPVETHGVSSHGSKKEVFRMHNLYTAITNSARTASYSFAFLWSLAKYVLNLVLIIPIAQILDNDAQDSHQLYVIFDTDKQIKVFSMMFYAEEAGGVSLSCTASIAGALFGGVHCIAWNFTFPSHVEQVIWRTASLGVVGTCALAFVGSSLWNFFDDDEDDDDGVMSKICYVPFFFLGLVVMLLTTIAYPVSRLLLLVLAVTSLRSLPPSVFATVQWVEFIPHI